MKTDHNIVRMREVKNLTGLSKATIYRKIAKNQFPKQVSLGERIVGWLDTDIQKWILDLPYKGLA